MNRRGNPIKYTHTYQLINPQTDPSTHLSTTPNTNLVPPTRPLGRQPAAGAEILACGPVMCKNARKTTTREGQRGRRMNRPLNQTITTFRPTHPPPTDQPTNQPLTHAATHPTTLIAQPTNRTPHQPIHPPTTHQPTNLPACASSWLAARRRRRNFGVWSCAM